MSESNTDHGFIDLFSGAGGFSSGFRLAGFKELLAIERDPSALRTYNLNLPDAICINDDIRNIHSLEIEQKCSQKPTVILASPPCEPFTAANTKRKETAWERFFEDPQGDLIFHAIRIIKDLNPDFFVIENVVPIIDGEGKDIILEAFADSKFQDIYFNVIRAEKHGSPSSRKRVFISNINLDLEKKKTVTVGQVLSGLQDPSYPNDLPNHFLSPVPDKIQKRIHQIKPGHAAVYFEGALSEKVNWVRLDKDKVSPTVMGKSRFIHFHQDRALTVREHGRLMTFHDDFKFTGTIEEMYNQVGEAVPPLISYLIAEEIKKQIS
ncbi:MAG: DNA cytosine methyltransferase [Candidatus Heimdallarchaeaceae archaeon]